jgi:acetylornithine deacetylase/succinyl-diaminopimelate desuccinylase-like protein
MNIRTNEEILATLKDFLRIPSISTRAENVGDVRRAAEFLATRLRAAELPEVRLIEKPGAHPLVYACSEPLAGKPTLLIYGHYDVQPPEPLELWHSPPFEPAVRNQNIYARGAVDDKGLSLLLVEAVARLMARDGRLPINIRFLMEGEEECGGGHIASFVSSLPPEIAADAVLLCDTEMFAPELPTLCTGLRGIVYGELTVRTAEGDLHSGVYGGAVPNAHFALCELLASLKDRNGVLQIEGIYDGIIPPAEEELAAWERLPFEQAAYQQHEAKVFALTGEPRRSVLERTWARPTLEVHGILGGFTGEGAKTVIPAEATAKISLRIVPGQTPERVVQLLEKAVAQHAPVGARTQFHLHHTGPAWYAPPSGRFVREAALAMEEVFGRPAVYARSGGSIPVVSLFSEKAKLPCVLPGFGLPDDNLHAPNEKLYLPNFYRGIDTMARYFERLGA